MADTLPSYLAALQSSWVPARSVRAEGRVIGITPDGGRRLNAAMLHGDEGRDRLTALAQAMHSLNAEGLFQCPIGSEAAQHLREMGYHQEGATDVYSLAARPDLPTPPGLEVYTADAPLALMRRFWAEHGTNAARQAAMARAQNPVFVMVRAGMELGGLAFVGGQGPTRMMHALIVAPALRGKGIGRRLVAGCAYAAHDQGATQLTWLTEADNTAAHAAFRAIGAQRQPGYCYHRMP